MFKFSKGYFIMAVSLLITEALIAAYLRDNFIRPTGGDFLVVILLYCSFKSFLTFPYRFLLPVTLAIAYIIEILQYFHFIRMIGLQNSVPAKLILGEGFAWTDMLAYTAGIILVWFIERLRESINLQKQIA